MRRVVVPAVAAALVSLLPVAGAAAAAGVCDVSGTLLTAGGAAVPGVDVWFDGADGSALGKTGPGGAFAFPTACGQATLQVYWRTAPAAGLPGIATLRGTVEVTDGRSFALRLPPAVTATVHVTDEAGEPVPGAGVFQPNEDTTFQVDDVPLLAGAPAFDASVELAHRRTDAAGNASHLTFADHDMNLRVRPPVGSPLQPVDVVIDASTSVTRTIALSTTPAGVPLSGVVRDSAGRPVPGLRVGISGGAGEGWETDAAGAFTVYGPATGPAQLYVGLNAYDEPPPAGIPGSFGIEGIPVTVGSAAPVEVTLPPVSHVRLTVVEPPGHPVRAVKLQPPNSPHFYSDPAVVVPGTPARQVRVSLPHILAERDVIEFDMFRTASVKGLELAWSNSDDDPQEMALPALNLGADVNRTVQLPPPPDKHLVTGVVTDAEGRVVPGLRVSSGTNYATLDAKGRFTLAVFAGRSTLGLERSITGTGKPHVGWMPDSFQLWFPVDVPGPRTIALKLPRVHQLTVSAVDPVHRKPVPGAWVNEASYDGLDLRGLGVGGAAGPGRAWQYLHSPATNSSGVTVVPTFTISSAAVVLSGKYGGARLSSHVLGLEVLGDKRLDLVLGSGSGSTYRRPGTVSGVTAVGAPSGTATVRTAAIGAAATRTVDAKVRWTAPRTTGGMKITGYRVTASPGGKTFRVGPRAREAVVPKLARGTAYTFTVRAVNAVGRARTVAAKLDVAAPRARMTAATGPGRGRLGEVRLDRN